MSELGTAYFHGDTLGEAEKAYRTATQIRPSCLLPWINLGRLLVAQEDFEKAIQALEGEAWRLDPKRAETAFLIGESYLQLKLGSKAVAYFSQALELDPDGMAEAHLRMGRLYDLAGLKERAAREYAQFLQKRPEHPEADQLRAYIKAHGGGAL